MSESNLLINPYVDKYGLYHDEPVMNQKPKSNNGWLYTAYARTLDLEVNYFKLQDCFDLCNSSASEDDTYFIYRLPDKRTPVLSRDEIIGMVSLGFNPLEYGWFMYRRVGRVDYLSAIYGLWKIRKEDRNYHWENEMLDLYPVSMKLGWHDRYYVNHIQDEPVNLFYMFMFNIYALTTILQNNVSAKNVLFLQLFDMNSKVWIRFIDRKKNFMTYFGQEHIFNKGEIK